ncbi:hypothetical protein BpHYR1_018532 [Brachionus plicatilis]|uniref:Uncharacterized protein n=1 Tax=Brachionus plicatilis TaxID=10195 RepID=A0A3M7RSP1_BRAPC|nr:hypothetical protein BpHYR1_018532 [Brachionus plicatilis]
MLEKREQMEQKLSNRVVLEVLNENKKHLVHAIKLKNCFVSHANTCYPTLVDESMENQEKEKTELVYVASPVQERYLKPGSTDEENYWVVPFSEFFPGWLEEGEAVKKGESTLEEQESLVHPKRARKLPDRLQKERLQSLSNEPAGQYSRTEPFSLFSPNMQQTEAFVAPVSVSGPALQLLRFTYSNKVILLLTINKRKRIYMYAKLKNANNDMVFKESKKMIEKIEEAEIKKFFRLNKDHTIKRQKFCRNVKNKNTKTDLDLHTAKSEVFKLFNETYNNNSETEKRCMISINEFRMRKRQSVRGLNWRGKYREHII